jgi:hypothetical protein
MRMKRREIKRNSKPEERKQQKSKVKKNNINNKERARGRNVGMNSGDE